LKKNRVAITGIGIMSPLGLSLDELLMAIRTNQSGVRPMDTWADPSLGIKTRVAAPVASFEDQSIDRKLRRTMSRVALLSMKSTQQALADSNLPTEAIKSERMGISFGSSFGGTSTIEEFFRGYQKHGVLSEGVVSTTFLKVMPHTCAANIAISFGIPGRIIASCVACASSTQAIGYGFEAIQWGLVDRMVCGGAEELTPTVAAIFDVLNATSTGYHDRPNETPKPFDVNRDGIVVGEGAGTFILENMDQAQARGAKIYAEVLGFYSNNDATHMTNPSVEGLVNCMQGALQNAGLKASEIDYINAHAAGTAAGDRAELLSIAKVFGPETPVSSMKGHVGHLMGAAGVVEAAACMGMFQDQALYPTLNFESAGEDGDKVRLLRGQAQSAAVRTILKNSFAFGGVNASLIIQSIKDQ